MHFHAFWEGPMPVIGSIRTSLISCSQCGHLFMSAPPGDGCVGTAILPQEVAGTLDHKAPP